MFVNKELRVPVELRRLAEVFQSMLAQKIVKPNLETDLNKPARTAVRATTWHFDDCLALDSAPLPRLHAGGAPTGSVRGFCIA